MTDLWTQELNSLKRRFWLGETLESLAEESGIHPDALQRWFLSNRLYKETDVASTPDDAAYIPGDEL